MTLKEKCTKCGQEDVYINGLCEDCYQLNLIDYAVEQGKDVSITYDGKKFYK